MCKHAHIMKWCWVHLEMRAAGRNELKQDTVRQPREIGEVQLLQRRTHVSQLCTWAWGAFVSMRFIMAI